MFKSITPIKERDACLALAFLLLLIWWATGWKGWAYFSMAALLLGMIWPGAMKPFAWAWFGLAALLGHVTSSILLGLVWFVLVLPMGLIRRMMGKDSMRLNQWRKNQDSCFADREHEYTRSDMEKPW